MDDGGTGHPAATLPDRRTQRPHLHHAIDARSIAIRAGITLAALLSLPIFGAVARALGDALELGRFVLPLLVLAHVPVVIAQLAVWSIGCDGCRTEEST